MDKSKTLREAPFAFSDLTDATTDGGIRFQILGWDEVRYACRKCSETFPQTEEGWQAFRAHEGEHGRAMVVDLSELDGKTLRIVAWQTRRSIGSSYEYWTPEIWGIDEARGFAYHLSNSYQSENVWKWRINSQVSGALGLLNAAMPPGQE